MFNFHQLFDHETPRIVVEIIEIERKERANIEHK